MVMRARPGGAPQPPQPNAGGAPRPAGFPPQASTPPAAPAPQAGPRPGAPRPGGPRPGVAPQTANQTVDISDPSYAPPQQAAPAPQAGPVRPGGPRPGGPAPTPQTPPQAPQSAQPPAAPAPLRAGANLPSTQVGGPAPKLAELNPMLQGLDGIGENNRVGLSLAGFEYKATQDIVQELNIVVTGGVKLWQKWGDTEKGEEEGLCQSYDHKTSTDGLVCATCPFFKDKSCKFKFEVRWNEPEDDGEGGEVDAEKVWTMSTSSAVTWLDYLKELAQKLQVGSHQVNTRVNYEIKRAGTNMYACAMFTPTHYYNAETGEYTDIPAEWQFTTRNKK